MENNLRREWAIIRNPKAGGGKSIAIWPVFRNCLHHAGFHFKEYLTEEVGHATLLGKKLVEQGYRNFIAFGGDGTLNEVINGLASQTFVDCSELTLTQFPSGTGNDWCRAHQIPEKVEHFVEFLLKAECIRQDVGLLTILSSSRQRYFINVAGAGFDAYTGNIVNQKKSKNKFSYLSSLLQGLFSYKDVSLQVYSDGKEVFFAEAFSLILGICPFFGNGMKPCPKAVFNDGLLDVTLVKKIGKLKLLSLLPRLYKGKLEGLKEVNLFTSRFIEVKTNRNTFIQLDGEVVGSGSFTIQILEKHIQILTQKNT